MRWERIYTRLFGPGITTRAFRPGSNSVGGTAGDNYIRDLGFTGGDHTGGSTAGGRFGYAFGMNRQLKASDGPAFTAPRNLRDRWRGHDGHRHRGPGNVLHDIGALFGP